MIATGAGRSSRLQRCLMLLAGGVSLLAGALGSITLVAVCVVIGEFHGEVSRWAAATGNPVVIAEIRAMTDRDQLLMLTILLLGLVSAGAAIAAFILVRRKLRPSP